ncbi:MAG: formyltetrahydrofolate deformylase [Myxococcales bacterium]|nr:formyltetrahydrofolate deformylase [Myxococcales bacterium]
MRDTATLLIDCPDQRGIVAAVSELLYRHGANIVHADQHQDAELQLFFMRVEWDVADFTLSLDDGAAAFHAAFAEIANRFAMKVRLERSTRRPRLALFVSKYDHCLADLLYRWHSGELRCDIVAVVGNHRDAEPLAQFYKVPFHHFPLDAKSDDKAGVETRQLALLRRERVDLVVLARYMQILSPRFVAEYPQRIINVHHSFLPAFIGAKPYHQAFERGVKLIGATSHYVTEQLDDGPIIEQSTSRISHRDELPELLAKGRELEKLVLSRAVRWHIESRILVYGKKTVIFD